jgi:hypothetical protein
MMIIKAFVGVAYLAGLAEIVAAGGDNSAALLTYGPLGIITAWLMYRDEKRSVQFRDTEARNADYHHDVLHRIDGLTKALLVDKIESADATPEVRRYARETVAKIDARAGSSGRA